MTRFLILLPFLGILGCEGEPSDTNIVVPDCPAGETCDDVTPNGRKDINSCIYHPKWTDDGLSTVPDESWGENGLEIFEGAIFSYNGQSYTTAAEIELGDIETVDFTYERDEVAYIGQAIIDPNSGTAVLAHMCVDLSGDWECWFDGYEDQKYPSNNVEMNGCQVKLGPAVNDYADIDGHHFSFLQNGIDAIIADDAREIKLLETVSGMTAPMTCVKR